MDTNRGNADWRFQTSEGTVQARTKFALQVNHGDMMRDPAVSGLAIAMLPTFSVRSPIDTGLLQKIVIDHEPETELIYMAHQRDVSSSAKIRPHLEWGTPIEHLGSSAGDATNRTFAIERP